MALLDRFINVLAYSRGPWLQESERRTAYHAGQSFLETYQSCSVRAQRRGQKLFYRRPKIHPSAAYVIHHVTTTSALSLRTASALAFAALCCFMLMCLGCATSWTRCGRVQPATLGVTLAGLMKTSSDGR